MITGMLPSRNDSSAWVARPFRHASRFFQTLSAGAGVLDFEDENNPISSVTVCRDRSRQAGVRDIESVNERHGLLADIPAKVIHHLADRLRFAAFHITALQIPSLVFL